MTTVQVQGLGALPLHMKTPRHRLSPVDQAKKRRDTEALVVVMGGLYATGIGMLYALDQPRLAGTLTMASGIVGTVYGVGQLMEGYDVEITEREMDEEAALPMAVDAIQPPRLTSDVPTALGGLGSMAGASTMQKSVDQKVMAMSSGEQAEATAIIGFLTGEWNLDAPTVQAAIERIVNDQNTSVIAALRFLNANPEEVIPLANNEPPLNVPYENAASYDSWFRKPYMIAGGVALLGVGGFLWMRSR